MFGIGTVMWWLLPLLLYTGITYCSALWFLYPLFLASCFYAVCLLVPGTCFLRVGAWSFLAALILIFPCVVVLLEFHSLAATCGALFILVYTTIIIIISVKCLVIAGRVCKHNHVLKVLSWTSIFIVWWWFVDTFFFVCVGVPCGYVIANPVLCCAVSPYTCVVVSFIGVYGLLALYLLATGGSVLWYVYRSRTSVIMALIAVGILCVSALTVEVTQKSKVIRYVPPKERVAKDISLLISSPNNMFSNNDVLSNNDMLSKERVPTDVPKKNIPTSPWEHVVAFKFTGREKGVLEIALELQRQFLACNKRVLVPDLIVGPESCLPCALNNESSLYALFDNPGSCLSPRVLLGARRQEVNNCRYLQGSAVQQVKKNDFKSTQDTVTCLVECAIVRRHNESCKNNKCFNTAFIMHQGRITYHYDKLFPLPFLETSSPFYFKTFFLRGFFSSKLKVSRAKNMHLPPARVAARVERSLFLSEGKTPYSVGTGTGETTLSLGGVTYQARLALCSDFFCTHLFSSKKSFSQSNPLLIVLTHDNWFYGTSVADRMHRYAVLWAVCHQIPVLYVGNCYASWIEPSGRTWSLGSADS